MENGMSKQHLITSMQHPFVKNAVKLREDASTRAEQQLLLLEGLKVIYELKPAQIKALIYTSAYTQKKLPAPEEWIVTEAIMQKIAGTATPEGIVALVKLPEFLPLANVKRVIALDGISDPGNMGTLMRTALAFGWEAIYLLPNCCDPYNEKVLRAARGAHFKLQLARGSASELARAAKQHGWQQLVADLDGSAPENIASTPTGRLLVLGNEARGPSSAILEFCAPVTLSMPGEMESLNVAIAGGILMYLLSADVKR